MGPVAAAETPEETIARLKAENKQLKKGLKSNLRMLQELEELYEDEKVEMEKQLKVEQKEKKSLAKKLDKAEKLVKELQTQIACDTFDTKHAHKPFWELMKEMEQVSGLIHQKIGTAKNNAMDGKLIDTGAGPPTVLPPVPYQQPPYQQPPYQQPPYQQQYAQPGPPHQQQYQQQYSQPPPPPQHQQDQQYQQPAHHHQQQQPQIVKQATSYESENDGNISDMDDFELNKRLSKTLGALSGDDSTDIEDENNTNKAAAIGAAAAIGTAAGATGAMVVANKNNNNDNMNGSGSNNFEQRKLALAVPKRDFSPLRDGTVTPPRGRPEPADADPKVMQRRRGSLSAGMAKLKRGVKKINMIKQVKVDTKTKFINWSHGLRRQDPRYQILWYFDQIAKRGTDALHDLGSPTDKPKNHGMGVFNMTSVFTVWRPTSLMSIRRMMNGEGVGKGLDIKGKSAKKGPLSAFVPFLQLHEEKHKHMVRTIPITAKVRMFFYSREARDQVQTILLAVMEEMIDGFDDAQDTLERLQDLEDAGEIDPDDKEMMEKVDQQREEAYAKWMWEIDIDDEELVAPINDYADKGQYGILVSQRIFFELYVMRGDCYREKGGFHDTGRLSEPAFQDMNMETLKKGASEVRDDMNAPRPVVIQYNKDPSQCLDPKYLVIAYEENGGVCPVVSDFDCFLVGTRRINFEEPLPADQLALMKWCINQIEKILALEPSSETWTMRWLEGLKEEYKNGFHVDLPKYGFADPKSYNIMAYAVDTLAQQGSVRHGAECFNYYFPQDLDDEFLVITNYQVNGPWVKYSRDGLLDFLSDKIDEGFMFPMNPKWLLCDPGWMKLWDKQMATTNPTARKALDAWFPKESGVRETIERIHKTYPKAFQVIKDEGGYKMTNEKYSPLRHAREKGEEISSENAMDMALLEVKHDQVLRKALKAVNAIIFSNRMARMLGKDPAALRRPSRGSKRSHSTRRSRRLRNSNASDASISSAASLGDLDTGSMHSLRGSNNDLMGLGQEEEKKNDKEKETKVKMEPAPPQKLNNSSRNEVMEELDASTAAISVATAKVNNKVSHPSNNGGITTAATAALSPTAKPASPQRAAAARPTRAAKPWATDAAAKQQADANKLKKADMKNAISGMAARALRRTPSTNSQMSGSALSGMSRPRSHADA